MTNLARVLGLAATFVAVWAQFIDENNNTAVESAMTNRFIKDSEPLQSYSFLYTSKIPPLPQTFRVG